MEEITRYRNTDLDLTSTEDLTSLAAALEGGGLALMRDVTRLNDRVWFCGFSMGGAWHDDPESSITSMLAVIEALDPPMRSAWDGCLLRMFDIGYDCGREPFATRQELSAETLVRLAAVGGSLRITLYSDPETTCPEPGPMLDPTA